MACVTDQLVELQKSVTACEEVAYQIEEYVVGPQPQNAQEMSDGCGLVVALENLMIQTNKLISTLSGVMTALQAPVPTGVEQLR